MKYYKNILETIGNTPLVKINQITKDIPALVLAKVETTNPGNSIKDRMAIKMIEDAEKDGRLKPGGTIIEGTSGNTGMGLAIAAIMKILNNVRDHGLTQDEFNRIKVMMDGQNLLGIQTNEDYAQLYSIPVLHNLGLDFTHHNNDQIREADYQEFQSFLKEFFNQNWNIVKAGRA